MVETFGFGAHDIQVGVCLLILGFALHGGFKGLRDIFTEIRKPRP